MKLICGLLCLAALLTGCTGEKKPLQQAMDLRQGLLEARGCSFDARITADYGDSIQSFTLSCQGDRQGNLTFQVMAPENIGGIGGTVEERGGALRFDGTALYFPLLTDDQLSPVSAPWIFLRTLRGGYLRGAGKDGSYLMVTASDSYRQDALQVDFWLDGDNAPVRGEILWKNRKILTLELENFQLIS